MIHRHLDYPPSTPVAELAAAAVADILDRGDLDDWADLARAVAADPFGPLAGRVAGLVDAFPMYGTSSLWRAWIERCRVRSESARGTAATDVVATLPDLRRAGGMTQAEVSERLGISQSDVSKLERRADIRVSTLRDYLTAVGARLRLIASTDADQTEVELRDDGSGGNTGRHGANHLHTTGPDA